MKTKLDEIDRQIIRYKRQGFSQAVIAETLGLTQAQVYYKVRIMKERFGVVFYNNDFSEMDKIIIDLKNRGVSNGEIASVLNVSNATITVKVKKLEKELGITFPHKKRTLSEMELQMYEDFKEGLSNVEIAKKYNLSSRSISDKKKKIEEVLLVELPVQRIDDKDEQIRKLRNEEHFTSKKIGESIGMSAAGVRKRLLKIDKIEKRQLAKMIVNLMYTKHASIEQIQKMGEYYGVDVEEILNTFNEQER